MVLQVCRESGLSGVLAAVQHSNPTAVRDAA